MKEGTVLIIGRPNVGKSTFLNNLIGQKVAITSPKPQTTRFPIRAVYKDKRGNIIFVDTPGVFGKTEDLLSRQINKKTLESIQEDINLVLYMVDHTRKRDFEEAKVLGIVRKINKPKILVINKIDKTKPSYLEQYKFLENEFDEIHMISALKGKHIKSLIKTIFKYLPKKKEKSEIDFHNKPIPLLNIDSKTYVAELIREKIFLLARKEVPYTVNVIVEEITEKEEKNLTYVKAKIITTADRYKRMLIGKKGKMIKEIGRLTRKELELMSNKKFYLDLEVITDPHWQERIE